jgi:hypothetical protein
MATPNDTTKRCTKCGEEFPATTEFFRYEKRRDMLVARCLSCSREDSREARRKWREENPEEYRRRNREEQKLLRQRRRDEINAKGRERHRRKYWENPELARQKQNAKFRRKQQIDPTKHRAKGIRGNAKRKAQKLQNTMGEHFTTQDVELQLIAQNGNCWWCGEPLEGKYHIDHRIPLVRGGSNDARNICLAHEHCNLTKSDKMPWEYNGRLL